MLGRTHISLGLLALPYVAPQLAQFAVHSESGLLSFGVSLVALVIGSLAPDLDQPGSTLTRDIAGPFGTSRVMALIGGVLAIYLNSRYHIHHLVTLAGIALLVMAFMKHRGITHSIFGVGIAWYAVLTLQHYELYQKYVGISIVIPFTVGYVVHLLADFCTNEGISPLYPVLKKRLGLPLVSIRTGSLLDRVVLHYGALLLAIMHFLTINNISFRRIL